MLALSVAFLMSQAGLWHSVRQASTGNRLLFAIAVGEWNLTPTMAMCVSMLIIVVYATILGALIVRTNRSLS